MYVLFKQSLVQTYYYNVWDTFSYDLTIWMSFSHSIFAKQHLFRTALDLRITSDKRSIIIFNNISISELYFRKY